jgi:hypothetical protein
MSPADQNMAQAIRLQSQWCRQDHGAPFTADLLLALLRDFESGGDWRRLLGDWPNDPVMDAASLRGAGALHRLALKGVEPFKGLFARLDRDPKALLGAVQAAGARPEIAGWLKNPPQTNEVARSSVFLGGFFEIARTQGRPLRLLEVGASGGLNLLFDRYGYRLGDTVWGDQTGAVQLKPDWTGPSPQAVDLKIHSRRGGDQLPVDLADPEARLRLLSYVWADQADRVTRVRGALEIAKAAPLTVDRADAADWVEAQVADLPAGVTTVLYHSFAWLYFDPRTQHHITAAMQKAGAALGPDRGLAWLTFESEDNPESPNLDLTLWPGGEKQRLARAHPHGRWVKWSG